MRKSSKNRQKAKSTQFVMKVRKLHPWCLNVLFRTLISFYDDTSNILRNSYGSLCLESLLQIAANVKIIETRPQPKSTLSVMKFENFIFNVSTVQFFPLISCDEARNM